MHVIKGVMGLRILSLLFVLCSYFLCTKRCISKQNTYLTVDEVFCFFVAFLVPKEMYTQSVCS